MGGEFLTEKETLDRLGISPGELEQFIEQGSLTPEPGQDGSERRFPAEQVDALASIEAGGADSDDLLFDLDAVEDGEAVPGEKEPGEDEDEDSLFAFDEELATESGEAGEQGVESEEKQVEEAEKDEPSGLDEFDFLLEDEGSDSAEKADGGDEDKPEPDAEDFLLTDEGGEESDQTAEEADGSDMITEVIDVSELEGGEEELLSDVIEDSGDEVSREELRQSKSKKEQPPSTNDPTVDITELDDETELFDSKEATSEITQLDDEPFEDEVVAEVLGDEAGHDTDFDEDDLIEYGEAVTEPEPAFPAWVVVLLVVVVVLQIVGIVYVVENTLQQGDPTGISEALNIVRFFQ